VKILSSKRSLSIVLVSKIKEKTEQIMGIMDQEVMEEAKARTMENNARIAAR